MEIHFCTNNKDVEDFIVEIIDKFTNNYSNDYDKDTKILTNKKSSGINDAIIELEKFVNYFEVYAEERYKTDKLIVKDLLSIINKLK